MGKKHKRHQSDPDINEFGHAPQRLTHVTEKNTITSTSSSSSSSFRKLRQPMKLEFAHEKFTKHATDGSLPLWAHDSRKIVAEKNHRKENLHEIKVGMTEFLYRDLQAHSRYVANAIEARFKIESRPVGVIGLSSDDCFVRSISNDADPQSHVRSGNQNWKVNDDDDDDFAHDKEGNNNRLKEADHHKFIITSSEGKGSEKLLPLDTTISSSTKNPLVHVNNNDDSVVSSSSTSSPPATSKPDFKTYQPKIVDTPSGLDLAPISSEGKKRAVFVLRLKVVAGTTPESIVSGLRQRVQGARHRSAFARDEYVPCDVRFETNSNGFLLGTPLCATEVNCRVRTWAQAHHCLLPDDESKKQQEVASRKNNNKNSKKNNNLSDNSNNNTTCSSNNIFKFHKVATGLYSIDKCWSLEEWKKLQPVKQPSITEYNLLIRGSSDCSMPSIFGPMKKVRDSGFINYSSNFYFGMPIENSVSFARAFIEGKYTKCFIHHFLCLARGSRLCTKAVSQLKTRLEVVVSSEQGMSTWEDQAISSSKSSINPATGHVIHKRKNNSNTNSNKVRHSPQSSALRRNLKFEWRAFIKSIETAIDETKHTCVVTKATSSDIDVTPLNKILEIAQNIEQLDGDCTSAFVEQRLIPDIVIQWHLRSLSDFHFNTLASIRVKKYGSKKVVPGDVVCLDENVRDRLDVVHAPNFYVPTANSFVFDRNTYGDAISLLMMAQEQEDDKDLFKVVESESEAKEYTTSSIVLPKWGVIPQELIDNDSNNIRQTITSSNNSNSNNNNDGDQLYNNNYFNWLLCHNSNQNRQNLPLPTASGIDWQSCARISKALNIPSPVSSSSNNNQETSNTSSMITELHRSLLPPITYRALFAKPKWLYAHCWDDQGSTSSTNFGLDSTLCRDPNVHVFPTECDHDGWRRILTLGANLHSAANDDDTTTASNPKTRRRVTGSYEIKTAATYNNNSQMTSSTMMIVPGRIRPAVKFPDVRETMLATIPKKAVTTAVRIALPSGVALSSALREVFQTSLFESREVAARLDENMRITSAARSGNKFDNNNRRGGGGGQSPSKMWKNSMEF